MTAPDSTPLVPGWLPGANSQLVNDLCDPETHARLWVGGRGLGKTSSLYAAFRRLARVGPDHRPPPGSVPGYERRTDAIEERPPSSGPEALAFVGSVAPARDGRGLVVFLSFGSPSRMTVERRLKALTVVSTEPAAGSVDALLARALQEACTRLQASGGWLLLDAFDQLAQGFGERPEVDEAFRSLVLLLTRDFHSRAAPPVRLRLTSRLSRSRAFELQNADADAGSLKIASDMWQKLENRRLAAPWNDRWPQPARDAVREVLLLSLRRAALAPAAERTRRGLPAIDSIEDALAAALQNLGHDPAPLWPALDELEAALAEVVDRESGGHLAIASEVVEALEQATRRWTPTDWRRLCLPAAPLLPPAPAEPGRRRRRRDAEDPGQTLLLCAAREMEDAALRAADRTLRRTLSYLGGTDHDSAVAAALAWLRRNAESGPMRVELAPRDPRAPGFRLLVHEGLVREVDRNAAGGLSTVRSYGFPGRATAAWLCSPAFLDEASHSAAQRQAEHAGRVLHLYYESGATQGILMVPGDPRRSVSLPRRLASLVQAVARHRGEVCPSDELIAAVGLPSKDSLYQLTRRLKSETSRLEMGNLLKPQRGVGYALTALVRVNPLPNEGAGPNELS